MTGVQGACQAKVVSLRDSDGWCGLFAIYMRPSSFSRRKRRSGDKVRQTDLATIAKTASLPVAYFGDLGWGSWTDGVTPAAFSDDTGFVELVERVRIGVA